MKKIGFTLMEVLIALAIIAIGATLITPIVSGLRPDANKAKILKVNKLTNEIIQELLADTGLYMNHSNFNGRCEGLNCFTQPTSPGFNNSTYSGSGKFPNLFASRLSLVDNVTESIKDSNGNIIGWEFQTTDGISWEIQKLLTSNPVNIYKFTVDVDGLNVGEDCEYGEIKSDGTKCKTPDTFTFEIDKWGRFSNRDKLMQAYLKNPYKLNDKEHDKNVAENQGNDAPTSLLPGENPKEEQKLEQSDT